MDAIKFEQVHFSYQADEKDEVFSTDAAFSLDGIDFSVQEGEFVAVLGHNGSGKSTLARLANGLLEPTAGKITVLGYDAGDMKNLFEIRKRVGIVFQNPDNQTVASIVEDDIAFGPENIGVPREEIGARIDFALKAVGMEKYRHATTSRLSGGQKQRIAIAGVLALKPRVMILDESTAMLDPRGRKEVMEVVQKLNKDEKITVILITHFPEEALLADRAVVMHRGKIVMEGRPEEVLKREDELKKCSLVLPKSVKLCRELCRCGLPVSDAFTAEDAAARIIETLEDERVNYTRAKSETPDSEPVLDDGEETGGRGSVYCRDLSFVYSPSSPFATHALNGVNLDIRAGEFFGIIGHTGSGKSTFVQHLNALLKLPTAEKKYKPKRQKRGKPMPALAALKVNGFDLAKKTTDFKQLRRHIGMVFQYPEYQLFAETVFDDVAFGLKNFVSDLDDTKIEKAVRDAIETVGLNYDEVKNRSPFELSGGQKRRVAIAGVIVTKPEILVLDEPAAGLDPMGKEDIMSLLHAMHKSWCKTVIIVSHDMDEIAENCTRAAIFSDGKILAVGEPKNLFKTREITDRAGLDVPFTARVLECLRDYGMQISCDMTLANLTENILKIAGRGGAGMRPTAVNGGCDHA